MLFLLSLWVPTPVLVGVLQVVFTWYYCRCRGCCCLYFCLVSFCCSYLCSCIVFGSFSCFGKIIQLTANTYSSSENQMRRRSQLSLSPLPFRLSKPSDLFASTRTRVLEYMVQQPKCELYRSSWNSRPRAVIIRATTNDSSVALGIV